MNDAERLSQDPTFRLMGSEKIWEFGAAPTSRLRSFGTDLLTQAENLAGLAAIVVERHLTRRLFGSMVRRIEALPAPTGSGAAAKGNQTG